MRRALAARGLLEAVTWSFMDRARAAAFTGDEAAQAGNGTVLANPISSDLGVMRPSILPNLVDAIQRNADRGTEDLALFEVAPVYASDRPEGQSIVAAGARALRPQRHWARAKPEDAALAGVMAVKADAIGALSAAGVKGDQLQTSRAVPTYFHPGRAGVLQQGPKNRLAAFGELHPGALAALGADGPLFGFEVYLDAIPNPRARSGKTRSALDASEFMPLTRDFAFIVDEGVEAGALLKAVRGAEKALLADAVLFDVYRGKGVDPGKKSLAVEVTLQPKDKTLTEAEIEAVAERIVTAVHKAVGGALRA